MNGQDVKCRRDAHCGQIRQTRRTMANGRHYLPTRNRARNAIRTRDTRFRRAVLYPLSYRGNEYIWYTFTRRGYVACGIHTITGR